MDDRSARSWVAGCLVFLALLTTIRLAVCGSAPLSADESYYWVWSRALAPGYLDHPPMTALWIRTGTLLFGSGAFGVRALAPLSAAFGTLLLASAAADFGGSEGRGRRAVVAGTLLNATLLLGIGSVTMTPDTPLLFFWTLALAALGRLLATGRGVWWLLAGVAIGLALDSKYTAFLTGAGLAGWLIATGAGRRWLRTPWPWAAGLLAFGLFAPVMAWNHAHDWVSFARQGGRAGDWHPARAGRYLAELLGGQLGLATPLVFVLLAAGMVRATRAGWRGSAGAALLAWVTLLPLAVFAQHALGDRVQANWPGLLYPAASIAAAVFAPRWWRQAALLGFVLTAPVYAQAAAAPFRLPRALDVTLQRLAGWQMLADQAGAAARSGFIAADEYGVAAELARALPDRTVLGVERRWALFELPHRACSASAPGGMDGILVRSERRHDLPDPRFWSVLDPVGVAVRGRAGQVAERYRLFRVRLRSDLSPALCAEIALLPAPH